MTFIYILALSHALCACNKIFFIFWFSIIIFYSSQFETYSDFYMVLLEQYNSIIQYFQHGIRTTVLTFRCCHHCCYQPYLIYVITREIQYNYLVFLTQYQSHCFDLLVCSLQSCLPWCLLLPLSSMLSLPLSTKPKSLPSTTTIITALILSPILEEDSVSLELLHTLTHHRKFSVTVLVHLLFLSREQLKNRCYLRPLQD